MKKFIIAIGVLFAVASLSQACDYGLGVQRIQSQCYGGAVQQFYAPPSVILRQDFGYGYGTLGVQRARFNVGFQKSFASERISVRQGLFGRTIVRRSVFVH